MEYYNLSATALAESINVQRSSISHLLSGRNKPSLEFVLRILQKYPEVELYWLLNGKGDFPKTEKKSILNESKIEETTQQEFNTQSSSSEIEKIVIFYSNGTFKSYKP